MVSLEALWSRPGLRLTSQRNKFARDVQRRPTIYFLDQRRVFTNGVIEGRNRHDLANAFGQCTVVPGDVLELTYIAEGRKMGISRRLLYLEPINLSDRMNCAHKFLPEQPTGKQTSAFVLRRITSWKKIGHLTPQEWRART